MTTLADVLGPLNGRQSGATTALSWTTETESNSAWFAVERSVDGNAWATIGQVAAAGYSNTALAYRYTDAAPDLEGNDLYYRLKLVDKDGASLYSNVVLIKEGEPQIYSVAPSPFTSEIAITCTLPAGGPVEVVLNDAAGATLARRKFTADKGGNVFRLTNLAWLARGVYIVRVLQGGVAGVVKVTKL